MGFHKAALLLVLVLFGSDLAAIEKQRIIAFGDSITRGLGDGSLDCDDTFLGYPGRLQRRLAEDGLEVEIVNQGECEEISADGLTRIDSVLSTDDDFVILMEGTNDFSDPYISVLTVKANIAEMARKAEVKGVTPVILSVVPRRADASGDFENRRTAALAGLLAQEAEDAGRLFANPYEELNLIPLLFSEHYSDSLHPDPSGYDLLTNVIEPTVRKALLANDEPLLACDDEPMASPCVADAETLCLRGGRFAVEVAWRDSIGRCGNGQAVPRTPDTGSFWFFSLENTELIVKVLDGRPRNGYFWFFYGALSNVEYVLRVTDSATGACRVYENLLGNFASAGDTEAFPAN